jgi:hypothetical protein
MRKVTFFRAAGILGLTLLLGYACTFPEITFEGSGGSSSETTATGGGTATSGTGGGPGSGGAGTSTSASSGASGGGGSGGSSGNGGAEPCGVDPCDCDDDGEPATRVECGGLDCADRDPRANPSADYQPSPIIGPLDVGFLPFDFNCDGLETPKFPNDVVSCPIALCDTTTEKWIGTPPPCGQSGHYGRCKGNCTGPFDMGTRVQRCR